MANDVIPNEAVSADNVKRSFFKDFAKGAAHYAKVVWQVPAAQSVIATLLIRWGVPSTLVAIGMAVGEKLAQ